MENLKAVIFDMDGVIFDSERLYMECCKEAAEIFGVENIEKTVLSCIGVNTEKTHEIYRRTYGENFPLEQFWKEATGRFAKKAQGGLLPVKKGAREILEWLKKSGIPAALASSTRTEMVIRELSAAGLKDYFKEIVGGDMAAKSKPDPDIFLLAAQRLDIPAGQCIIIEDSINGIKAARASGAFVIMVPDLAEPTDEEKDNYTDLVLSSLTEVQDYLLKLPISFCE